jgi:hypothetical protein
MSERIEVIDECDYVGSYHEEVFEDGSRMVFVHMDVYYWSPSVLKKQLTQWPIFRALMSSIPLFCMGTQDDLKFQKYISKFGFVPLKPIPCTDGQSRMLYINWPTQAAQD